MAENLRKNKDGTLTVIRTEDIFTLTQVKQAIMAKEKSIEALVSTVEGWQEEANDAIEELDILKARKSFLEA